MEDLTPKNQAQGQTALPPEWVSRLLGPKGFPLPGFLKEFIFKRWELVTYIFFGGCTTLVSFGVQYLSLLAGFSTGVNTTLSWIFAVLFAFFTNRIWVFNSPTRGFFPFIKQLLAFFGARLFSFLVELAIMLMLVSWLGFPEMWVKVGASVIVLILNYILSKLVVFRKKPAGKTE